MLGIALFPLCGLVAILIGLSIAAEDFLMRKPREKK